MVGALRETRRFQYGSDSPGCCKKTARVGLHYQRLRAYMACKQAIYGRLQCVYEDEGSQVALVFFLLLAFLLVPRRIKHPFDRIKTKAFGLQKSALFCFSGLVNRILAEFSLP